MPRLCKRWSFSFLDSKEPPHPGSFFVLSQNFLFLLLNKIDSCYFSVRPDYFLVMHMEFSRWLSFFLSRSAPFFCFCVCFFLGTGKSRHLPARPHNPSGRQDPGLQGRGPCLSEVTGQGRAGIGRAPSWEERCEDFQGPQVLCLHGPAPPRKKYQQLHCVTAMPQRQI